MARGKWVRLLMRGKREEGKGLGERGLGEQDGGLFVR